MNSVKVEETNAVNHPILRERVERGKRSGTREFVALIGGVEAGLLIFEHFPCHSVGLVYEIYVLEKFRAMGVGNQLLSQAETVAVDSACKTLRLTARSLDQEFIDDDSLISWYGRKGFSRDASTSGEMQKNLASKFSLSGQLGDW
jgi:GNAT superfamily N-acetyltransferase